MNTDIPPPPNIVYILADDMGYGDLGANNPESKIPTPNLDRLAAQGIRFTDAHAPSSLCTPSRYALLTGRYSWRSRLKQGIVWEWDGALLEEGRVTVASFLRAQGYHTACLGKWHLGWDWATHDGRHPNEDLPFGSHGGKLRQDYAARIDWRAPIRGGPVDRGFDTYFGVDVPNFPPYTWFENDRLSELPTVPKPDAIYGSAGLMAPGWSPEQMIPAFTRRAVALIEQQAAARQAGGGQPYFLFFPLTSPHSPVVPNAAFKGRSGAGNYGDFVCEVDWVVGQVMDALERTGTAENTLLVFASDNGPEGRTPDDIGVYERLRVHGHSSKGPLRGHKRDLWEGGHRVPFVARWPSTIPAGTVCGQLTTLGDLMATAAEIVKVPLPPGAGEDSVSILPLLRGQVQAPVRESAVHHSGAGRFAIRRGDWVYIDAPCGGDNAEPDWFNEARGYGPHEQPGELFDLRDDLSERVNRYAEQPDIVQQMKAELEQVKAGRK